VYVLVCHIVHFHSSLCEARMSFSRCLFIHFHSKEPLRIWRQPLAGVPSGLLRALRLLV